MSDLEGEGFHPPRSITYLLRRFRFDPHVARKVCCTVRAVMLLPVLSFRGPGGGKGKRRSIGELRWQMMSLGSESIRFAIDRWPRTVVPHPLLLCCWGPRGPEAILERRRWSSGQDIKCAAGICYAYAIT